MPRSFSDDASDEVVEGVDLPSWKSPEGRGRVPLGYVRRFALRCFCLVSFRVVLEEHWVCDMFSVVYGIVSQFPFYISLGVHKI